MVFVLALLLGLVNPFNTYAKTIDQVLNRIEYFYKHIHTIQADFLQETFFLYSQKKEIQKGIFWIKKPDKFRWEYKSPEKFVIISDGKNVYIYYPEEEEAFVYTSKQLLSSHIAIGFMSGKGNIKKDLKLQSFKVLKHNFWKITFLPAYKDQRVKEISLIVNPDTGEVKEFGFINYTGERIKISFKNIKYNIKLNNNLFTLKLPKDVEIIPSY